MLQDQYISIAASPSTAGGDFRRLAVLLGELDKAVKVLNLSAGPVSMSIVRATKMFLTKQSELDFRGLAEAPVSSSGPHCLAP